LSGINIFIGKNNAGKSTLLHALNYAIKGIPPKNEYIVNNYKNKTEQEVKIYIKYELTDNDIDLLPIKKIPGWDDLVYVLKSNSILMGFQLLKEGKFYGDIVNKNVLMEAYKSRTRGKEYYTTVNNPLRVAKANSFEDILPNFENDIKIIIYNIQNIFISPYRTLLPEQAVNNVAAVLENGDGSKVPGYVFESLHNGQLSDQKTVVKEIIKEVEYFLGFKKGVSINPLKYNSGVLFSLEEENKKELPITFYGQGTISIFLLIFYLKFYKIYNKPLLMFIDEPENSLHPGLQKKVLRYFIDEIKGNKNIQLFIATHSPSFIELSDNASVYYVDNEASPNNMFSRITKENITAVLDPIGFSMSHLGLAEVVIFGEGKTECEVLNEFLCRDESLAKAIEEKRILFHIIGGDNIVHYDSVKLKSISLKSIIWIDSELDNKASQIKKEKLELEKSCMEMGIPFFMNRDYRCIENILTKKAIAEYYGLKSKDMEDYLAYEKLKDYEDRLKEKGLIFKNVRNSSTKWVKSRGIASLMTNEEINKIKDFVKLRKIIKEYLGIECT